MNFGSSQEQDETAIELTPLIDVVFLLLIFFMISTTFTKETSLQINLPEASGEEGIEQPKSIEVQVSADAEYAIARSFDGVWLQRLLILIVKHCLKHCQSLKTKMVYC